MASKSVHNDSTILEVKSFVQKISACIFFCVHIYSSQRIKKTYTDKAINIYNMNQIDYGHV